MKVYIVEAGDYEQRSVHHVAASLDAAVRDIRAGYVACGSVIEDSDDAPVQSQWSDREWNYTVIVLEQSGHRLTKPMRSCYDVTEWDVSE